MKRLTGLVIVTAVLLTASVDAQEAISQPRYKWMATPCANWSCALAAMAVAQGDPYVFVLPTKSTDHPWIILKRQEIGVVDGPIDNTFEVEGYSGVSEATARYVSIETLKAPMLVTTMDGSMLVICLHESMTKRRAVAR